MSSQTATEFEKTYTPLITGATPKDLVFLIDFSLSTAESIDLIKSCLKSLVMKTPFADDNHRICIIQYGDRAVVDQPFTHESNELISTICGMSRRSGNSAATDVGLDFAKNKILDEGRNNARKVVIVITGGGSNNCDLTRNSASELKQLPGTNVICLGVGHGVNKREVKEIASDGMSFIVESYAEMDKIFSRMILTSQKPILVLGERGTDVIYLRTKSDEEIDTTFLEMYDEKKRDWVQVDKARSTNVQKSGLASGTEYQFRAKVTFTSGITSCYSDIVKATTFKKEIINSTLTNQKELSKSCVELVREIKLFELDPLLKSQNSEYNILLLGLFGNGKSSLTNLMRGVIGESPIAQVGSSSYHVTQEVNAYKSFHGKAQIWDIFGWDDQLRNINDGQLIDLIVDGRIEIGSEMKENGQIEIGNKTDIFQKIHAIIVVVSSEVMTDDEYLNKLEKINKILIKKKYEPIYVLNKMDLIDERLSNVNEKGQGISLMYNSPSVLTYKELFVKKTRINPENIYPLVCQLQKNISLELRYLILLLNSNILNQAQTFFDRSTLGMKKELNNHDVAIPSQLGTQFPLPSNTIKVMDFSGGPVSLFNLSDYVELDELLEDIKKKMKISTETITLLCKYGKYHVNVSKLNEIVPNETYFVFHVGSDVSEI